MLWGNIVPARTSAFCQRCPKGRYQPNVVRTSKCWACPHGQTSTDSRVECSAVTSVAGDLTPLAVTPQVVAMQHVIITNGDEVPNDYEKHDREALGSHYSEQHSEDPRTANVQPTDDDWLTTR